MHTTGMKDNLITEVVKMYAPELARASAVGGKGTHGKGSGHSNKMPTNSNNKGKGKGKGKGKSAPATAFAQLRPCENINMFFMPDGSVAPVLDGNLTHTDHRVLP